MKRFLSVIFSLVVLCISLVNAKENGTIEHIGKDIILTYDGESITLSNETIDGSTQKCPFGYHIGTADDWSNIIKMRYNIKGKNYEYMELNNNGFYKIDESFRVSNDCRTYKKNCYNYSYGLPFLAGDLIIDYHGDSSNHACFYKTSSYGNKHAPYYFVYDGINTIGGIGGEGNAYLTTNPNTQKTYIVLVRCFKDDKNITTDNGFSDEYNDAYVFAYNNKITTMQTIEEANMNGEIIRAEIAKMLANWVKKNGYYADSNIPCNFTDTASVKGDLATAIIESCKYGIMGQGITQFRPYDKITKAEVATAVSRILRGTKYDGGNPFYINHVNALENAGILADSYNINSNELRGNVMTILMKANNILEYNSIDCETPEYILLCTNDKEKCPEKCKK